MIFHKYHGAGNDFLVADNRKGEYVLSPSEISSLCNRNTGIGGDGLILLETGESADFKMKYFNSDGSGGMMCGNGGRCIAAFADFMGIKGHVFEAADGLHEYEILSNDGRNTTVRLKMSDVPEYRQNDDGTFFINTGTNHQVGFYDDIDKIDVVEEGRKIRYDAKYLPHGTNVNFVMEIPSGLKIRTYEKGVENETMACGTGITASALASACRKNLAAGHVRFSVRALISTLSVDFIFYRKGCLCGAKDVFLTGPAYRIAKIYIED